MIRWGIRQFHHDVPCIRSMVMQKPGAADKHVGKAPPAPCRVENAFNASVRFRYESGRAVRGSPISARDAFKLYGLFVNRDTPSKVTAQQVEWFIVSSALTACWGVTVARNSADAGLHGWATPHHRFPFLPDDVDSSRIATVQQRPGIASGGEHVVSASFLHSMLSDAQRLSAAEASLGMDDDKATNSSPRISLPPHLHQLQCALRERGIVPAEVTENLHTTLQHGAALRTQYSRVTFCLETLLKRSPDCLAGIAFSFDGAPLSRVVAGQLARVHGAARRFSSPIWMTRSNVRVLGLSPRPCERPAIVSVLDGYALPLMSLSREVHRAVGWRQRPSSIHTCWICDRGVWHRLNTKRVAGLCRATKPPLAWVSVRELHRLRFGVAADGSWAPLALLHRAGVMSKCESVVPNQINLAEATASAWFNLDQLGVVRFASDGATVLPRTEDPPLTLASALSRARLLEPHNDRKIHFTLNGRFVVSRRLRVFLHAATVRGNVSSTAWLTADFIKRKRLHLLPTAAPPLRLTDAAKIFAIPVAKIGPTERTAFFTHHRVRQTLRRLHESSTSQRSALHNDTSSVVFCGRRLRPVRLSRTCADGPYITVEALQFLSRTSNRIDSGSSNQLTSRHYLSHRVPLSKNAGSWVFVQMRRAARHSHKAGQRRKIEKKRFEVASMVAYPTDALRDGWRYFSSARADPAEHRCRSSLAS